jgi:YtkA-like
MRYLVALTVLVVALAAPVAASAGGWASVVVSDTPAGTDAGDTWTARITVLRHGVTPTDGAMPSVSIVNEQTRNGETFAAEPTGETGVYEAAVVFPESGTWRYEVDNGLAATGYGVSQVTSYPPVTIGSPGGAGAPGDDGLPALPLAGFGLALAFAAAVAFAIRRSRRLTPASH